MTGWPSLVGRERSVADMLQRGLLPAALPVLPGVRLAARYPAGRAGAQVGGDWYDAVEPARRPDRRRGRRRGRPRLAAAAAMGQLRSALRAYAR